MGCEFERLCQLPFVQDSSEVVVAHMLSMTYHFR